MPRAALMSVEEYLRTSWEPDVEYVDGEIVARPLGERGHSTVQANIIAAFMNRRKELRIRVKPEFRIQTSETRFRVPDILIEDSAADSESILSTPPLLCIEILSPEDSHGRAMAKVQEYLEFGVPCVWVIDPLSETAWIHTRTLDGNCLSHAIAGGALTTPDGRLSLAMSGLFDE